MISGLREHCFRNTEWQGLEGTSETTESNPPDKAGKIYQRMVAHPIYFIKNKLKDESLILLLQTLHCGQCTCGHRNPSLTGARTGSVPC